MEHDASRNSTGSQGDTVQEMLQKLLRAELVRNRKTRPITQAARNRAERLQIVVTMEKGNTEITKKAQSTPRDTFYDEPNIQNKK